LFMRKNAGDVVQEVHVLQFVTLHHAVLNMMI